MHNCIPQGQLECGHVPRLFLLPQRVWFWDYHLNWPMHYLLGSGCAASNVLLLAIYPREGKHTRCMNPNKEICFKGVPLKLHKVATYLICVNLANPQKVYWGLATCLTQAALQLQLRYTIGRSPYRKPSPLQLSFSHEHKHTHTHTKQYHFWICIPMITATL